MQSPRQEDPSADAGCDPAYLTEEFLSDARWMRRRERFYEKALGPMREPGVFHWQDDHDPHIDVYVFGSPDGGDRETLITGGMADRPMPCVPARNGAPRRAEVLLTLSRGGERRPPELQSLDWAAMILREIASIPFLYGSPLAAGRLIEGTRSIRDGSDLQHAVLRMAEEPGLDGFVVDGDPVRFFEPLFLTQPEFLLGMERGGLALIRTLERAGVARVLDPGRRCTIGG